MILHFETCLNYEARRYNIGWVNYVSELDSNIRAWLSVQYGPFETEPALRVPGGFHGFRELFDECDLLVVECF